MISLDNQVLSIRPDIRLTQNEDGSEAIQATWWQIPLGDLPEGVRESIRQLFQPDGASVQVMMKKVTESSGHAAIPRLFFLIEQFRQQGILCRTINHEGEPWASLIPTAAPIQQDAIQLQDDQPYQLSRFVYFRHEQGSRILESPLAHCYISLSDPQTMALLYALAEPTTVEDLGASGVSPMAMALNGTLQLLAEARMISQVDEQGRRAEDSQDPWRSWEFHDLLFHSRSRRGRHAYPYGGTNRFGHDPLPAVGAPEPLESVKLEVPDLEAIERDGPGFETVLSQRRSIRHYGETPIDKTQLAEFLYRCARIKGEINTPEGSWKLRPYPSGGALYELQVYAVVKNCTGLQPGVYHYDAEGHNLTLLQNQNASVDQLLLESAMTTGVQELEPQVLIVIAARFSQVAWKYQSMAYALCLKDTGVLLQTMYLVAEAMQLAPCALGGGDSDLFARASQLDYLEEGSVGEFLLGSRPAGDGQ